MDNIEVYMTSYVYDETTYRDFYIKDSNNRSTVFYSHHAAYTHFVFDSIGNSRWYIQDELPKPLSYKTMSLYRSFKDIIENRLKRSQLIELLNNIYDYNISARFYTESSSIINLLEMALYSS